MALKDDIRNISQQDRPKKGLVAKIERASIPAIKTPPAEERDGGIRSPVTLEVLAWDETKTVTLSGGDIVKTALNAQIIDADGTVIEISEFIYPELDP